MHENRPLNVLAEPRQEEVARWFRRWHEALEESALRVGGGRLRPLYCKARVLFTNPQTLRPAALASLRNVSLSRDVDDPPEGNVVEVNPPANPGTAASMTEVVEDAHGAFWLIRRGELQPARGPNDYRVDQALFAERTKVPALSNVRFPNGNSDLWYPVAQLSEANGAERSSEAIQRETERFFNWCQLARNQLDPGISQTDLVAGKTGYMLPSRPPIEVRLQQILVVRRLRRYLKLYGVDSIEECGRLVAQSISLWNASRYLPSLR